MKKILVKFGIIALIILAFLFGKIAKNDIGRYQIYMNPIVRADQLLLDTKTGRTWQFTQESKEKYMFWHEIPRDELSLPTDKE